MDFKVDVSLWRQPAGPLQQNNEQPSERDFKDAIGLASHSVDDVFAVNPQHVSADLEGKQATVSTTQKLVQDYEAASSQVTEHRQNLVELYALGLYAGAHLSHLPSAFQAADVSPIETHKRPGTVIAERWLPASQEAGQAAAARAAASAALVEMPLQHAPERVEPAARSAQYQQASSYLARHWSERSVQLLRRGENEMELVVRDYHLSASEQADLTQQFVHELESLPHKTERIWMNGQVVWQRSINA